jgi:ABC-2 type transport system ATP-binding protein
MSNTLISAQGVSKRFGKEQVFDGLDFTVKSGEIVGLIGPNGAGKSTLLRAISGQSDYQGQLTVMGKRAMGQRTHIMKKCAYISDVATLPDWLKVSELLAFMANIQPCFNLEKAQVMVDEAQLPLNKTVGKLSKGMKGQLHLAIVIAMDCDLMILDEPTLGLDILFRDHFYRQLLEWFHDGIRSIIITSHQIDEVEDLLTHIMLLANHKLLLNDGVEQINERFLTVKVEEEQLAQAKQLSPITVKPTAFGASKLIFDQVDWDTLSALGQVSQTSLSDLFTAKLKQELLKGEVVA